MKVFVCLVFSAFFLSSCHHKTNYGKGNKKPCEVAFVCPKQPEYITGYSYFSDDNEHRYFVGNNTATTLNIDFHKLRNTHSGLPINYTKLLSSFKNKKDSLCCLKRVKMYNGYYLEDYLTNKDSIETFLEALKDMHFQYFKLDVACGINDFLKYLGNVDSIEISTCDTIPIDINAFLKTTKELRYFSYLYDCRSLEWDKNPIGCELRGKILFDTSVAKLNPKLEYIGINVAHPEEYFLKNGKIFRAEINR